MSGIEDFYVELLCNEYNHKWAFLMDSTVYFDVMRSLSLPYRVYLILSRVRDPDNKAIYWSDLVRYVSIFYEKHVVQIVAMDFADFMAMTNFCMTVEIALQYRRERLDYNYYEHDHDFQEVLLACIELQHN
jgi:hypothetical protein